jgi:hypothetical protein
MESFPRFTGITRKADDDDDEDEDEQEHEYDDEQEHDTLRASQK